MKVGPALIQGPRLSIDPAEPAQKIRFLFSHNVAQKLEKNKSHLYCLHGNRF